MTNGNGSYIVTFDDLIDHVLKQSPQDQKDLVEVIFRNFFEKGWEIQGNYIDTSGSFTLSKTEMM